MNGEMSLLLARMTFLLGQMQEAMGHMFARNEAIKSQIQQSAAKAKYSECEDTADAQYLALEEAIRQQRKSEAWQRKLPPVRVVEPLVATGISLGLSNWRLEMNGWRLVAKGEGFEVSLHPEERSLLLCVAQAPCQFLTPHEVRELNRSLVASTSDAGSTCIAEGDAGLDAGEQAIDVLHTKVIARLRRRMRMNGYVLPLRASTAGSIYIDETTNLAQRAGRRPGGPKPFLSQSGEREKRTSRSGFRGAASEAVGSQP